MDKVSEHALKNGYKFPRMGMNHDNFTNAMKDITDYIVEHYKTMDKRIPCPDVKPGFMKELLPSSAPEDPEDWENVKSDLNDIIMKGMTHWQAPGFMAYFPCASSYPAILAEPMIAATGCIGFTWISSPSCTELEITMMNWLAKAVGLPDDFLHREKGNGGGVIQGSSSESTIMMILTARKKAIKEILQSGEYESEYDVLPKLVAYSSEACHSSVERACRLAMVRLHKLPVNSAGAVEGSSLQEQVKIDKERGLIPIFMCATLGTTVCCSFDDLVGIGKTCKNEDIWLHVDAAYAGSSFVCPEFRGFMKGIEFTDSFNFNLAKWLMVNFDCSALWVKKTSYIKESLDIDPIYLQHEHQDNSIDFRHWQLPLGRRMRSIKVWFVFRLVGLKGLRYRIRQDVKMANIFKNLVLEDRRFEVVFPVHLGLVCIRLVQDKDDPKKNRELNTWLLNKINADRKIYIVPSEVNGIYFLRFAIGSGACSEESVVENWKVIQRIADEVRCNSD